MKKSTFLGTRLSWRQMFRRTGIFRHKSTKRSLAFCKSDVEKVKSLTLHSVCVTDWCPPPGVPLSVIRMRVSKGPSMELGKLAPSLVAYLEAAATNGCQDNGPRHEAFEVLEKALEILSNPNNSFGLSLEVLEILNELLLKQSKVNPKVKNTVMEGTVIVAIVNHILLHLTRGCVILNQHHSKALKHPKRTYLPDTFRWEGLALGHVEAWYGELDMLVCPLDTGPSQPNVAVLWEKSNSDNQDDAYAEEDYIEEGFSDLVIPEASQNWSLFGSHFSQGFATAVTFSYVHHYALSGPKSARSSLLPTIQISPRGYQIYLYDCIQDVMLANNFFWSRESLIYLWAFFHHHLFFPNNLPKHLADCVCEFGYEQSSGFYANRSSLLFGLSPNSPHWKTVEPEEGRML